MDRIHWCICFFPKTYLGDVDLKQTGVEVALLLCGAGIRIRLKNGGVYKMNLSLSCSVTLKGGSSMRARGCGNKRERRTDYKNT